MSVVLEEHVATKNGRNEKIRGAVVVDVGKRRRYADAARHTDPSFLGNVFELSTTQILPEFVAADLVHKIDVVEPVAVHIRHCDATAMVIMDSLIVSASILGGLLTKRDSAFLEAVCEM